MIAMTTVVLIAASLTTRHLSRARKTELNVFIYGSCLMFIAVLLLSRLTELTGNPLFRQLEPLFALLLYGGIVYAPGN